MRKYTLGSRYISLLLLVAMIFSFVPAMQLSAFAADEYDQTRFWTAAQDGITMMPNNENRISLPIKVNNFAMDGLLFDYLSSTRSGQNADSYVWEYTEKGSAYVQMMPYVLKYQRGQSHNFGSADGTSARIVWGSSLDASSSTTGDTYGTRSDGIQATRALIPATYTESGFVSPSANIPSGKTAFVRLFPRMWKDTYQSVSGVQDGDNPDGSGKGRAWTKLTTFDKTQTVETIRYVAIVYRLPNGNKVENGSHSYSNFGLTINSFDEAKGNCSKYVSINPEGTSEWQYAIVDLLGRGNDKYKIATGTSVDSVYLQAPLAWNENGRDEGAEASGAYLNGTYYMDIAAVGYFPYYGDAEQFAYAGLTLGCQQKYFNANNAGFSLRNNTNTHYSLTGTTKTQILVRSLPTFWNHSEYPGARPLGISTYDEMGAAYKDLTTVTYTETVSGTTTTYSLIDVIGNNLFGKIKGDATLGLVETELGENGLPVYKESVVHYLAAYLRHQLLTQPEYPSDNNGWRNYSFITGVSTVNGTDMALYGKDEYGRSLDLASALCKQIGVKKGGAITSGTGNFACGGNYNYSNAASGSGNAYYGSYANTLSHKDELIGTWENCKKNIHTWFDAAYFLLHNLFVSETDSADTKVDGYGDYENTYQTLVLPQVTYTDGSTPYFFDSGYSYYTDINDKTTYKSALTYNKQDHTITMNADAQGIAQFHEPGTEDELHSSWFPFLLTNGNGSPASETNSPYYLHGNTNVKQSDGSYKLYHTGVSSREDQGTTYKNRDFHYSMVGSGYFAYERGLYFNFSGDDDVYVFLNGQLAIDIGGTHGNTGYDMALDDYVDWANSVKYNGVKYKGKTYSQLAAADKARVDAFCMVVGGVYSFDFFYMERHGVGSNLRIMTNMYIVESGLDVEKSAYQEGIKVDNNGIADADGPLEYCFSITNNSDGKLYNLSFADDVIGVKLDPENGLVVTGNVTNSHGAKLTPSGLSITVDGYNESGQKLDTVYVTCPDNASLKQFLKDLSADGTQSGDSDKDFDKLYSGSGLWKRATVTVRGIYYELTTKQKEVGNFTNAVEGIAYVKVAGEGGAIQNFVLRGQAKHTIYQPGEPSYYQWVGKPVVIESERLYEDLIQGKVVENAGDLPKPANMLLIPSDSSGTEIDNTNLNAVPGGDVYLTVNYKTPGSHMAYVTIRDKSNPEYSLTVPITIYVVGGQDSVFVLDYGLDTYLTDDDAIFDYELGATAGDSTGSVLGIAADTITPTYKEYDEDKSVKTAAGQVSNPIEIVSGTYDGDGKHSAAIYQYDTPIHLDHNKPWVLEWRANHFDYDRTDGKGTNSGVLLFSEMKTSTTDNHYVFVNPNAGAIYMGEHAVEHSDLTGNGTGTGLTYNNYGIYSDTTAAAWNKMTTYALVNEPDGAGGNMVYLYVNGTKIGAMNQYYQGGGGATATHKTSNWLSGKDFDFNFMGTTSHALDGTYEYIRVYEDGLPFTHYKWQMPGKASTGTLNNVDTGNTGYTANAGTYGQYTVSTSGNHKNYWDLAKPITLAHDESWVMSMTVSGITEATMLMSAKDTSAKNAGHVYFYPKNGYALCYIGYKNPSGSSHYNFGVNLKDYDPNFSMNDEHTYVFENHVLPTGQNMIYLIVDGTIKAPLDHKYFGSTELLNSSTTEISGMDFTFHRIGQANQDNKYGLMDNTRISNLEIYTKTTMSNSYEWVVGGAGMTPEVATDNTGNQIVFQKEASGTLTAEDGKFVLDGKGLKFDITDTMDSKYSAYVAIAIHDKGYSPTPLEVDGINVGSEVQLYKKITVLPANVVYYEDDFPAIHYYGTEVATFEELSSSTGNYDDYTDTYYLTMGDSSKLTQSADQDSPYGSDEIYNNISSNVSGGTLHTIAINNDGPLFWFRFTGRGFELSARTNAADSGIIVADIFTADQVTVSGDTLTPKSYDAYGYPVAYKTIMANTEYDNGDTVNGDYNMNNGGEESIYQVPVLRYEQEAVQTFYVMVSGVELLDFGGGATGNGHVDTYLYLDGIRIFQPLKTSVSDPYYGTESTAVFEEVRKHILNGTVLACNYDETAGISAGSATMTWSEKFNNLDADKNIYIGNAVITPDDYLMEGPNNEVYMEGTFSNGAIAFYVRETDLAAEQLLHIGVRAVDVGLYHGAGSTGMRANLLLSVANSAGGGWMFLTTVTSGTEQYVEIPYELCPVIKLSDNNLYYTVVLKVDVAAEEIPAMVSFTSIKRTEGLQIADSQFAGPEVEWNEDEKEYLPKQNSVAYNVLDMLSTQMAAGTMISLNEVEGGSTFVPEAEDEEIETVEPALKPKYPSVSLEDEVIYNFYFNAMNLTGVDPEDMGLLTFYTEAEDGTVANADEVISGVLYDAGSSLYKVSSNGIPAKKLGDKVYFKIYAELDDGSYVYSDMFSYSGVDYALDRLANSDSAKMKSLVVAMLNYGAAAQQYFGYKTDALANACLTAEQKALAADFSRDMIADIAKADSAKIGSFVRTDGFSSRRPSVSFESAFSINYFFTPCKTVDGNMTMYYWDLETYNSVDVLTAENATGSVIMTKVGNQYKASYNGIAAKEIDETVYVAGVYQSNGVTCCTGVLSYNLGAYCLDRIDNGSTSMQALASATAVYGYYAKEYFA